MQFRTPITISQSSLRLDHSHRVVMFGSCFSEHIAERMHNAGFHVVSNPFGIMFNPASIARNIARLSSAQPYTTEDLTLSGERWVSVDFHGDFASRSAEQALESMNRAVESGVKALREADTVVLTLGTAWVYRHNGSVVANCHKLPAQMFTRQMMSVDEITESRQSCLACLEEPSQDVLTPARQAIYLLPNERPLCFEHLSLCSRTGSPSSIPESTDLFCHLHRSKNF